jgi:adenine/guanine phosphoribosyltransferase-like PRPP-binding protein
MKTKIHHHNIPIMEYPIDLNYINNYNHIDMLSNEFIKFYKDKAKIPQIIATGSSGILIAGFIAVKFYQETSKKCEINVLRKSNNHHSRGDFEKRILIACSNNTPLTIVDDFIVTGNTIKRIYNEIVNFEPNAIIHSLFVTGSSDIIDDTDIFEEAKIKNLFIE